MTARRFIVSRSNGKRVVDTNTQEDEGISLDINGERISLENFLNRWEKTTKDPCKTCVFHKSDRLVQRCFACFNYALWTPRSEPSDPKHDSVYQRLEALEKKHANSDQMIDKRLTKLEDQILRLNNVIGYVPELVEKVKELELHNGLLTDPKIERLERARDLLVGRVKELEDQQKVTCIDLGPIYGKIYIPKLGSE